MTEQETELAKKKSTKKMKFLRLMSVADVLSIHSTAMQ